MLLFANNFMSQVSGHTFVHEQYRAGEVGQGIVTNNFMLQVLPPLVVQIRKYAPALRPVIVHVRKYAVRSATRYRQPPKGILRSAAHCRRCPKVCSKCCSPLSVGGESPPSEGWEDLSS